MIVDLSVALNQQTPVYPGDPKVRIESSSQLVDQGYADHSVHLGTHNGTHIDAPAHMIENGKTLDAFAIETFAGPGKLVHGFTIQAVEAADIEPGDIVLFDTGSSQRFREAWYFEAFPAMSEQVAELLIGKGAKLVGLDTCSADNQDGFPIHKLLLGAGIPIIETMSGPERLADKRFDVYALPLKLELDGAPARVIAVVHDA